jgi:CBS domain containing-hemolysin-like protein
MELLIFYLILAIGVSFFCSIMEAVLLSVTPSYIAILEKRHPLAGSILRDLKSDIDKPLSAILSLNTIAHTVGAAGVGAQAQLVFGETYVAIISAVLTFLILVLSEIIPKTLGANYWRNMAAFSARSLQIMIYVMYPFVVLARLITNLMARDENAEMFSREEFSAQVDLGTEEGVFEEKESRIFKNLIRFSSLRASDIMTPRTVVVAYPEKRTVEEVMENAEELRVSRIPVFDESQDNITGYVLKNDLLISMARNETEKALKEFRREIMILPDLLKLGDLFERLLERQEHIAVLVDEYGGLSGIVTMEDVVETLLGMEIIDEVDNIRDMQVLARQRWKERAKRLGLLEMNESVKSAPDSEDTG